MVNKESLYTYVCMECSGHITSLISNIVVCTVHIVLYVNPLSPSFLSLQKESPCHQARGPNELMKERAEKRGGYRERLQKKDVDFKFH